MKVKFTVISPLVILQTLQGQKICHMKERFLPYEFIGSPTMIYEDIELCLLSVIRMKNIMLTGFPVISQKLVSISPGPQK